MPTRVVVDPITRIEGHLRIEAQADNGKISNAWATSTQFRGIEVIMQGRDPRDAWAFTQRICGVCTVVHAVASCRAVEDALGITIPPNAALIRNLVHGMQYIQDHVIHFYHLHALDWVDVVSALKADPAGTAAIARALDPLYVANEGVLIAVVPDPWAERALAALRADSLGADAALIGRIVADHAGLVALHTAIGGSRIVDLLPGDQLPRIC